MNKLLSRSLFILCIAFAFNACKNDDGGPSPEEDLTAENRKPLGESSGDILSDETYRSVTVELVYSEFDKPSDEALGNLRLLMEERINKPGGITFVEREVPSQAGAPFTIDEIREIEDSIRTIYSQGDDIAIYVFFANGSSNNDTDTRVTLGTAYRNTSIVIYERTLRNITSQNPDILPILESVTLNHEFGHLLGLVNIQEDDIHEGGEHEDLVNERHCIVTDCLMFFEVSNLERSALPAMMERLQGRTQIPTFDPLLCTTDLQAKGGK